MNGLNIPLKGTAVYDILALLIMEYYTLQVRTRGEQKYIRLFKSVNPDDATRLIFPQRRLSVRRMGKNDG